MIYQSRLGEQARFAANRVGELLQVYYRVAVEIGGRYTIVQVELPVNKPLVRGVPYKLGTHKPIVISFKYERLQHFCYRCDLLGHMHRDCDCPEEKG